LRVGIPDDAGFGEGCGRDRLLPPQIAADDVAATAEEPEPDYYDLRYYNGNSKIPRDLYRLGLIRDVADKTYRLMVPITEISEVHMHNIGFITRFTIILRAYPTRPLSALEFVKDNSDRAHLWNRQSEGIDEMRIRNRHLFSQRIITIDGQERLSKFFYMLGTHVQMLVETLRVTTDNPYWKDAFEICSTLEAPKFVEQRPNTEEQREAGGREGCGRDRLLPPRIAGKIVEVVTPVISITTTVSFLVECAYVLDLCSMHL